MINMSALFLSAVRTPHNVDISLVPYLGSAPVAIPGYPNGLPVTGGSITVDSTQRARRTLTATIGDPRLAPSQITDLLGLSGVELFCSAGIVYPTGVTEWCPLGLFHIEETDSVISGSEEITIQAAPDRGAYVTDGRFVLTEQSIAAAPCVSEIFRLMIDPVPAAAVNRDPVDLTGGNPADAAQMTWTDSDRWAAISQLEDAVAAESFFDAYGRPTVRNIAKTSDPAVWTVDAGLSGVLIDATVKAGRTYTYNGVVVQGERTDGTTPVYVALFDVNPNSPTYWDGPFGHKPRFYKSPLITTQDQGLAMASSLFNAVTGWTRTLEITCITMPALEASDVILVTYPDGHSEPHIIDQMTIPLAPDTPMQIVTRTYLPPDEG